MLYNYWLLQGLVLVVLRTDATLAQNGHNNDMCHIDRVSVSQIERRHQCLTKDADTAQVLLLI